MAVARRRRRPPPHDLVPPADLAGVDVIADDLASTENHGHIPRHRRQDVRARQLGRRNATTIVATRRDLRLGLVENLPAPPLLHRDRRFGHHALAVARAAERGPVHRSLTDLTQLDRAVLGGQILQCRRQRPRRPTKRHLRHARHRLGQPSESGDPRALPHPPVAVRQLRIDRRRRIHPARPYADQLPIRPGRIAVAALVHQPIAGQFRGFGPGGRVQETGRDVQRLLGV